MERGERQELLDRLARADGRADQGDLGRGQGRDKRALVVGPAFAARIAEQTRGIGFFYNIRLASKPVWRFLDAISLNLYPLEKYGKKLGTPETSMSLLAKAKTQMRLRGVPASKPIWNTEVNYGMRGGTFGGTRARSISSELQASYVIRTYLLNAAKGVRRVHWYTWNMGYLPGGGTLGNTMMTNPANGTSRTLAGKSFALVRGWMIGGTLVGSSSERPAVLAEPRHLHLRDQVQEKCEAGVLEPHQNGQSEGRP